MKKIYESKTVWFNLIMMVVLVAQLVGDMYTNQAQLTALIAGVGNIVLRVWFTETKIEK